MVAQIPRAVILISGRGSNMSSLVQHAEGINFVGVISNRADAAGLVWASERGIPSIAVPRDEHSPTVAIQKQNLWKRVEAFNPDLVFLAGYLQIVEPEITEKYNRRIINVHPALLPALKGLTGKDTHARALAEGHARHGATIHLVDAGLDTGDIIAQGAVDILSTDTEDLLRERVQSREHVLYPWVASRIASGDITLASAPIQFSKRAVDEAREMGFELPVQ